MENKTRRAQNTGSFRKRSNGTWEGRVSCGYDLETGKRIHKSVYGKTKKEVVAKANVILAQVSAKTYIEPSKLTMNAWLDIWENDYLNSIKEATASAYKSIARNHIRPTFGDMLLKQIKPHHVQHFINDLISKGLSSKTILNIHGLLHKVFDQAVKVQYIQKNAAALCDLPKKEKYQFHYLDKTQIQDFLSAIRGDYYEDFFIVCLFTGMRISEAVGLTWDCINFETGTINIYRQFLYKEKHFAPTKNNKPRTVTPAQFVIDIFRKIKHTQYADQDLAGEVWCNSEGFCFCHGDGGHYYQDTIAKHFRKAIKRTNLPPLRFHDLRHSYAVLSIQAGDDFKTISDNMGHFSIAFTMDVYASVSEQMKKDSAERMQAMIESIPTSIPTIKQKKV